KPARGFLFVNLDSIARGIAKADGIFCRRIALCSQMLQLVQRCGFDAGNWLRGAYRSGCGRRGENSLALRTSMDLFLHPGREHKSHRKTNHRERTEQKNQQRTRQADSTGLRRLCRGISLFGFFGFRSEEYAPLGGLEWNFLRQ